MESSPEKKGCGVQEGSIFCLLPFLNYFNDLPNVCFLSKSFLLANDTSIFGLYRSDLELAKKLARLLKWFQWKRQTPNVAKTVYMKMMNKIASSSSLNNDNFLLLPLKSSKNLGVFLDSKLCFLSHFNELRLKFGRKCGIVTKVRHYVQKDALVRYYNSNIKSLLQR